MPKFLAAKMGDACGLQAKSRVVRGGCGLMARCLIVPTFSLAKGKVLDSVLDVEPLESKLDVDSLRLARNNGEQDESGLHTPLPSQAEDEPRVGSLLEWTGDPGAGDGGVRSAHSCISASSRDSSLISSSGECLFDERDKD